MYFDTSTILLLISFGVALLASGQPYYYPSANEVTLKDMGKYVTNHNKTQQSVKRMLNSLWPSDMAV